MDSQTTGTGLVQSAINYGPFTFVKMLGLALPLIVFNDFIKLKFNWGLSTTVGTTATCEVWRADYIYLDTDERRRLPRCL